MRLKVGFFSFTCCEGCILTFIEVLNKKYSEYIEKMNIVNFRSLGTTDKVRRLDIAFVEGAISTQSEIKKLKEIRSKARKLVALGSGAISGYPSNFRNKFSKEKKEQVRELVEKLKQIDKISPLARFVKVDDTVSGCPVSERALAKKIDGYLKNA